MFLSESVHALVAAKGPDLKKYNISLLKLFSYYVLLFTEPFSLFNTVYFKESDSLDSYRELTALCGIITNPCKLNINIQLGKTELIPELLKFIEEEIKYYKNVVIKNTGGTSRKVEEEEE